MGTKIKEYKIGMKVRTVKRDSGPWTVGSMIINGILGDGYYTCKHSNAGLGSGAFHSSEIESINKKKSSK